MEEKNKMMGVTFNGSVTFNGPMFDIHDNEHVHIHNSALTDSKDEVPHFPYNKTKDEGVALYNFLTKYSYAKVPLDSWLYLMGFVTEKPQKVVPITWLQTKEQLRTMLFLSFEQLINDNSVKKADLEKMVPLCFKDKDGNTMKLAKHKEEPSFGIDHLTKFFRPSSDQ